MSVSDRSTSRTVVIASLALVVTFIAGFVAGVVADRFMMHRRRDHRPPPMAAHAMLFHLDRRLDLTDAQEKQIRTILERRHQRMNAQWEAMRPRMDAEIQQTNAEIERVLTPEQREKFKELRLHLGPRMRRGDRERRAPTR